MEYQTLAMAETQNDVSKTLLVSSNDKMANCRYEGYHKALYAARNVDRLAEHFYEQGKADGIKDVLVANLKIINRDPGNLCRGNVL